MCAAAAVARPQLPIGILPVSDDRHREFYHVGGVDRERMGVVADIFHRILTPLYGSQDKALDQIARGEDRSCFLLYEEHVPVGVLVFKTVLSNEFEPFGVTDSIEVKSLFVDHAVQNSGKGLGSALVDKLKTEVARLSLGQRNIHVTVSETKQESLLFFQKKGFRIAHEFRDRYIVGVTEFLLACPWAAEEIRAVRGLLAEHLPRADGSTEAPELVDIIHQAHADDIHTFISLSDRTFVSGSKDNCLYKWSYEGARVSIVDEVEPTQQDERNWVTAAAVINDRYWVSGQRNGRMSLWKTEGEYVRDLFLKLPKLGSHVSSVHNARRINCLAAGLDPSRPSVFIGFPTMFDEFNFIEGRTESSTRVHANDWVFSIHPLTPERLLVVTGTTVDVWAKTDRLRWGHLENLIPEGPRQPLLTPDGVRKWQRQFISTITPLQPLGNLFALALFGGFVKVFDLESKRVIRSWQEHEKRVWVVEKVRDHLFASGAEDRTIKLWDVRQDRSVRTVARDVEVMSMLALTDHRLVAGVHGEPRVGSDIQFYDFRR